MTIGKKTVSAFALAALLSSSPPLHCEPRLATDPRLAELPANVVTLDADIFAKVALVASGCEDSRIPSELSKLQSAAGELQSLIPSGADDRAKSEAILALLYKKFLFRYSEFQTRVDVALDSGDYNCVSSAILFDYFAKKTGLKVAGVETPDHAFCTVEIDGKLIDVETTNPYGFDPGARKELPATREAEKRYVLVPQSKYYNRKPVGDRRFIALVYVNRISTLERNGNFEQAVALALDARELQNGAVPQKDFAERFLNYAISLANKGRNAEALAFIRDVAARWGDYPGYRAFSETALGNMLNDQLKKNDFSGALRNLSDYSPMIDDATKSEYLRTITLAQLYYAVNSGPFDEAHAQILSRRNDLGKAEYEKLLSYAYAREADRVCANANWLEASAILDSGLGELPGQRDLAQQRSVYRQNYAIGVHNAAVAEWRKGNADKAQKILASGLALVPESPLLQNDLKQMK